jgi:Flp pilus assembly protein TadG
MSIMKTGDRRNVSAFPGAARRRRTSGNMAIEAAMLIPLLLLLIVGTVQIGKVTYEYYVLKKIVWGAARQLSVQQGLNFCDDLANDPNAVAAINLALNDSTGTPIIANLTTLNVSTECADSTGAMGPCLGCPDANPLPGFLLVTVPDGYSVNVRIPFLNPIPITLQPFALAPFGGVS